MRSAGGEGLAALVLEGVDQLGIHFGLDRSPGGLFVEQRANLVQGALADVRRLGRVDRKSVEKQYSRHAQTHSAGHESGNDRWIGTVHRNTSVGFIFVLYRFGSRLAGSFSGSIFQPSFWFGGFARSKSKVLPAQGLFIF